MPTAIKTAALSTAIRLVKKAGFYPSVHGPTLYVDKHKHGKFLFYVDITNERVDRDNLNFRLAECEE